MTRVIAGSAKGMTLKAPKGTVTRPTSDRVKESLFSIIGARVEGARVLDLFAGTGGLGIEALSRGARSAIFVEKDRAAIQCIRDNLTKTKLDDRSIVIRSGRLPDRNRLGDEPLDIIFADPPYEQHFVARLLKWAEVEPPLRPGSLFVIEHSNKEEMPSDLKKFLVDQERIYGQTRLTFLVAK